MNRRSARRPLRRDDRGVSALIFAMLLTILLTMSAFAVDIGAAYTERRHDQNTVDAAVMSGAVEAVLGGGVIDDVVTEVRLKVDTTLGLQVSDEAWETCDDPDALDHTARELKVGNPVIDPETDCISFSDTFNEIRVRLPDQKAQAVFGPALGFGEITTSAAAVARIQSPGGLSAPPFVALSTATQGDFVCLRTSSAGEPLPLMDGMGPGVTAVPGSRADPCDSSYDPDSQSFGTLSPFRYKDGCTRQKADTEVAISLGIDHAMGFFERDPVTGIAYSPGEDERIDGGAGCTVAYPDTFKVETGFNASGLRCALISLDSSSSVDKSLCNGVAPRLKLGDNIDSTNTFAAEPLDNSAPWDFLRPADELWLGSVDASGDLVIPPFPNSPARNVCVTLATFRVDDDTFEPGYSPGIPDLDDYVDYYYDPVHGTQFAIDDIDDEHWDVFDRYDALIQCLELWDPATDPQLFTEDIALSPRFAFIPQVYEDNIDVPYVHIEGFLPSYMYRLYQATSGNGATPCVPWDNRLNPPFYIHDAGNEFGACGAANQNVDRMASLIFACGMVPETLCNRDTGHPNFAGLDIYDFRLVE